LSNPLANALALALLEEGLATDVKAAKGFAERFVEENAPLSARPAMAPAPAAPPVVGPRVATCRNCGQPTNDHMPGCAAAKGL
jgi:hypothetical protein